ncbi:MAG TPA: LPS assembly lipoprotein LptE [Acetobacteraceae bacterium]|nr:LPS assembly lipoprotein LptE [Acetobacteraceae bacterium]
MAKGNRRVHLLRGALGVLTLCLAGCGFHPLYAPAGGTPADASLSRVYVDVIGDRSGQLLRQALQARLDGSGSASAKTFELAVSYSISQEGISITQDNSVTRLRSVGRANWVLKTVTAPPRTVRSGSVRALDGYNQINEQYFYSTLENEAVERRLAETLADQITQQLAVYFRQHPERT